MKKLLLLGLLLPFVSNAALVTVTNTNMIFDEGTSITFDILGQNFTDGPLDGWGLDIGFDGAIVRADDSSVDSTFWDFIVQDGDINVNSITEIAGNSFADRTGNFVLATVEFFGLQPGISSLALSEWAGNPFATGGQLYPNLVFDDTITLTVNSFVVPLPPAVLLFGSALGLLGWIRCKR
jgi:hypothetical protein